MTVDVTINGRSVTVDAEPGTPLLWVLRDELNLTGTKFGCGVASCGACTVHVDGQPVRSCQTFIEDVAGAKVTTIEGLDSKAAAAVQNAWGELDVVQCGYCQSGQIMAAAAFLSVNSEPTDEDIDRAMSANLCRCGTYPRIREAVKTAAAKLNGAA